MKSRLWLSPRQVGAFSAWALAFLAIAFGADAAREAYLEKRANEAASVEAWIAIEDIEEGATLRPEMFEARRILTPFGIAPDYLVHNTAERDELALVDGLRAASAIPAGMALEDMMVEEGLTYMSWPRHSIDTSSVEDASWVDVALTTREGTQVVLRRVWLRLQKDKLFLLTAPSCSRRPTPSTSR